MTSASWYTIQDGILLATISQITQSDITYLYIYSGMPPNAQGSAVWPTVQDCLHYTYLFIEEHTNEDTRPKAKSAATHGWAGTFIDNLLKTHLHIEFTNTFKITISSDARYLSHLNAFRSGVLSSTTIGPIKWDHTLHYYYKISKPLRSTSRLIFQQIHAHISFPAQRSAVEPPGRLCAHRFSIQQAPSKTLGALTPGRRPSRLQPEPV